MISPAGPGNPHHITKLPRCVLMFAAAIGITAFDNADAAASISISIGPPGHALTYTQCATEGGTCVAEGFKYLAYGANGHFLFKTSEEFANTSCDSATFGGDPAPGVVKACYFANYSLRTSEGTASATITARDIAYGANGTFNFAAVNGNFTCDNATFGDPIPGVAKACYSLDETYNFGASEGGTLSGLNNTPVAYGANGRFLFKVASTSLPCTSAAFGSDPAPGVAKSCYFWSWPFITDEGNTFTVGSLPSFFYYGSGLNGNFIVGSAVNVATCSNASVGGDPDYGQAKHCYFQQ